MFIKSYALQQRRGSLNSIVTSIILFCLASNNAMEPAYLNGSYLPYVLAFKRPPYEVFLNITERQDDTGEVTETSHILRYCWLFRSYFARSTCCFHSSTFPQLAGSVTMLFYSTCLISLLKDALCFVLLVSFPLQVMERRTTGLLYSTRFAKTPLTNLDLALFVD